MIRSGSVEKASVQGGGGGGPAGARGGTSFSVGSAGGFGGVVGVARGAGSGIFWPAVDSAGTTNCANVGDEDVGSYGGENIGAESLSISVGEAGETSENGAGWA
jgi:hypothetical protein